MLIPLIIVAAVIYASSNKNKEKKQNINTSEDRAVIDTINTTPGTIIKAKYTGTITLGNEQNLKLNHSKGVIGYGGILPIVADGQEVYAGQPIAKVLSDKLIIATIKR